MIKISLVTALRGQHDIFENLLNSIVKNTQRLNEIELLVCIDGDDNDTQKMISRWTLLCPIHTRFFIVERSEHFTRDYINYLAKMADGRFVMNINADSEFVTPNWDEHVYARMEIACRQSKDDIWLGLVKDGLVRTGEDPKFPHFTCWPIVSKASIDTLGYFLDERFKIWGPDHFIAAVYRRANRLVSLTNVLIEHNSVHNHRRPDDGNYARFHQIDKENPFVITEEVIEESYKQLLRCIDEQHNKRS